MQINFEAKKLKEANEYVNLLNPPKQIIKAKEQISLLKKIVRFLFK